MFGWRIGVCLLPSANASIPQRSLSRPSHLSFFAVGMCPFNLFFHGVACELVKTELASLGLRTTFVPLQIEIDKDKEWKGVNRPYWQRDVYYLPIARLMP